MLQKSEPNNGNDIQGEGLGQRTQKEKRFNVTDSIKIKRQVFSQKVQIQVTGMMAPH